MTTKPSDSTNLASNTYRARTGRPPMVIKPSVLEDILLRTAEGESMRAICRDADMPSRTRLQKELVENSDFAAQYARARELMYAGWADEILEIADDGTTDYVTKVGRNGHEYEAVDQEHIQRSRLRCDSRRWLLSKLMPKVYGDKVAHDHGGEVMHRVDISSLSEREKMRRLALFMVEDRDAGRTIEGEATALNDGTKSHNRPNGPVDPGTEPAAGQSTE